MIIPWSNKPLQNCSPPELFIRRGKQYLNSLTSFGKFQCTGQMYRIRPF